MLRGLRGLAPALLLLAGCASMPPESPPPVLAVPVPAPVTPPTPPTPVSVEQVAPPEAERSVFFTLGSSSIPAGERDKLHALAANLKSDRNRAVILVGHANDNGSRSFNLAIADARLSAVAQFLRKAGVASLQIKAEVARNEPVPGDCRTSECRRTMRRVEWQFFNLR